MPTWNCAFYNRQLPFFSETLPAKLDIPHICALLLTSGFWEVEIAYRYALRLNKQCTMWNISKCTMYFNLLVLLVYPALFLKKVNLDFHWSMSELWAGGWKWTCIHFHPFTPIMFRSEKKLKKDANLHCFLFWIYKDLQTHTWWHAHMLSEIKWTVRFVIGRAFFLRE